MLGHGSCFEFFGVEGVDGGGFGADEFGFFNGVFFVGFEADFVGFFVGFLEDEGGHFFELGCYLFESRKRVVRSDYWDIE